jgi:hypothetical protein
VVDLGNREAMEAKLHCRARAARRSPDMRAILVERHRIGSTGYDLRVPVRQGTRRALARAATRRDDDQRSGRQGISRARELYSVQGVVGDHGVRVRDASPNVFELKARVVVDERLRRLALGEKAQDELDRNAHASDRRLSAENIRVHGDAPEEFRVGHFFLSLAWTLASHEAGGRFSSVILADRRRRASCSTESTSERML